MQSLFFKRCTWAMNVYSSSGNANSNHQQEHQHDAFKRQKANNDTNNMHRQHNASSGIGRTHKHKHAYAIVWSIANYICNRWMLLRFYIGACYTHKYITDMKRMRATYIDIHDVHIHKLKYNTCVRRVAVAYSISFAQNAPATSIHE